MAHTPTTCTVGPSAVTGKRCGKPAVWSDGEFAECAEHAADPIALARAKPITSYGPKVGDEVYIPSHGRHGTVVYVGPRGAVKAEFSYKNGSKRVVRV